MQPGKYKARAVSAEFGTTKSEKDFIRVTFEVEGESVAPQWMGWLSERAAQYTVEKLRHCGCTFPGDDILNFAGLGSRDVTIVVEENEYKGQRELRVGNVYPLEAAPKPMAADEKTAIKKRFAALVAASSPAPAAQPPRQQHRTVQAPPPRQVVSYDTREDDVPF